MSDYLFDGEGEPDAEIAQLEQLLTPLAHRGSAPRLPTPVRRRSPAPWIAAGVAAAIAVVLFVRRPVPLPVAVVPSWALDDHDRLPLNKWLETSTAATLHVDTIGTLELGPHTRARIVAMGESRVVELAHGTVTARIDAAPRKFVVRMAHASAIDLGCAFSLSVDDAGVGALVVTGGAVALADSAGNERVVTAGAACDMTDNGPGIVYAQSASPAFRAALARYAMDVTALKSVLDEARDGDEATLSYLAATDHAAAALIAARHAGGEHTEHHVHTKKSSSSRELLPSSHTPGALRPDPFFDHDR